MLINTNYAETLHQASLFNPTNSFLFLLLLLSSPLPLFFTHSPSRLFSLFNQMELQLLSFTVNPFYSSPFLVLFAIAPLFCSSAPRVIEGAEKEEEANDSGYIQSQES
ncbi:hypothetical protein Pint_03546 [Pistacia integerrima]|uniref:Uncharacterized protein n=1 Tax=Pistacia integerrima TaxID=434235 RepID=A0ACC0ZMT2_9ROSI|nr:hypothetical protein Pint_03546 [Pistacia integerrima]